MYILLANLTYSFSYIKYHPDVNEQPDATEKFKEISAAMRYAPQLYLRVKTYICCIFIASEKVYVIHLVVWSSIFFCFDFEI